MAIFVLLAWRNAHQWAIRALRLWGGFALLALRFRGITSSLLGCWASTSSAISGGSIQPTKSEGQVTQPAKRLNQRSPKGKRLNQRSGSTSEVRRTSVSTSVAAQPTKSEGQVTQPA